MSLFPIDTQQVVDKLTESGVPNRQARAHAALLAESLRSPDMQTNARLCSKSELQSAVTSLDAKIDTSIAKLKAQLMTAWMLLAVFLQVALIGLLFLLD